MLIKKGPSL